jgi:thiopeptide-type bacteriocin biosynthesis protein
VKARTLARRSIQPLLGWLETSPWPHPYDLVSGLAAMIGAGVETRRASALLEGAVRWVLAQDAPSGFPVWVGPGIAPAADRALASGAADRWFFVRYADPGPHLRVRLHGDPARLWGEVFPELVRAAQPFVDTDRIATVFVDTYDREIDRYGGVEGIDLAEQIFWADSEAAAGIVAGLVGASGAADTRWRIALAGIDRLLGDLGLDAEGKRVALTAAREAYGRRFEVDTRLGRQLGERYRKERAVLEPLLDMANDASSPLQPALALLRRRSERMAPWVAELRALERAGRLSRPVAELAGSFIHMFANRLFRGAANEQELVVYDLLARRLDLRRRHPRRVSLQPRPQRKDTSGGARRQHRLARC